MLKIYFVVKSLSANLKLLIDTYACSNITEPLINSYYIFNIIIKSLLLIYIT